MCSAFKQIVITVQRSNWSKNKQGRIHGNPVADIWAGAALRKPLGIQQGWIHGHQLRTGGQERKCAFSHFSTRAHQRTDQRTDGRTDGQSLL